MYYTNGTPWGCSPAKDVSSGCGAIHMLSTAIHYIASSNKKLVDTNVDLETEKQLLNDKVRELETKVRELESKVGRLEAKVGRLEAKVEEGEVEFKKLDGAYWTISDDKDRLMQVHYENTKRLEQCRCSANK